MNRSTSSRKAPAFRKPLPLLSLFLLVVLALWLALSGLTPQAQFCNTACHQTRVAARQTAWESGNLTREKAFETKVRGATQTQAAFNANASNNQRQTATKTWANEFATRTALYVGFDATATKRIVDFDNAKDDARETMAAGAETQDAIATSERVIGNAALTQDARAARLQPPTSTAYSHRVNAESTRVLWTATVVVRERMTQAKLATVSAETAVAYLPTARALAETSVAANRAANATADINAASTSRAQRQARYNLTQAKEQETFNARWRERQRGTATKEAQNRATYYIPQLTNRALASTQSVSMTRYWVSQTEQASNPNLRSPSAWHDFYSTQGYYEMFTRVAQTRAAQGSSAPIKATAPPPIALVSAGIHSYTDATVSWSAVSGATGYRLEYTGSDMSSGAFDLGAGTTQKRLTGLSAGVIYNVQITAYLPGGAQSRGDISFMMPTPTPEQQQIIGQGAPPDPPQVDWQPQPQQQQLDGGGVPADPPQALDSQQQQQQQQQDPPQELPSNTPVPPPPPTNSPVPPPPPTNSPVPPPPPTNTPVPPPPPARQEPQVDAGLLAEVEAKIARHRDETGRADLEAGFSKVRDGLLGKISPDDALGAIKSGWNNDLWNRIRVALEALKG